MNPEPTPEHQPTHHNPPDASTATQEPHQVSTIHPGQTLIVRYTRRTLSEYETDKLRAKLTERLPGVNFVILGPDIEPVLIYDPDPTE